MSDSVTCDFGTFTKEQLDTLHKCLREWSDIKTMMEAQSDKLNDVVNHVYDELKLPKKLIREMAKTYHKQNYGEVVTEQENFQLLYESIIKNK